MLYVVIPVHNRRVLTCRCLAAIQKVLPPDLAVVVVDDGSTDGTSEAVREQFPWVHLLHGDGNLWWSGSVNVGLGYALENGATVVMTMNDDTLVTDHFFPAMLKHHRTTPHALLGALEVNAADGQISYGGERINWWTSVRTKVWESLRKDEMTGLVQVTQLNARGLLIPVEVIQKIGLFDAVHLPQRGADDDFTHRASRAGFSLYCNYDAPLLVCTDVSPGRELRRRFDLKGYWRHLFTRHGDGNLMVFTVYALKNCPKVCLPTFLATGYARRLCGYWLHRPKINA